MYPLWMVHVFRRGNSDWGNPPVDVVFITRGRDILQIRIYIKLHYPMAGYEILNAVPLNGATTYSTNHAPGWLTRRMYWLERKAV